MRFVSRNLSSSFKFPQFIIMLDPAGRSSQTRPCIYIYKRGRYYWSTVEKFYAVPHSSGNPTLYLVTVVQNTDIIYKIKNQLTTMHIPTPYIYTAEFETTSQRGIMHTVMQNFESIIKLFHQHKNFQNCLLSFEKFSSLKIYFKSFPGNQS